jgi:CheY-like chemotaxis protein
MGNSNSKAAKRIVVVDDNEDICAFMSAALEGAGYEVETVTEGAQGLALLCTRPADLLITDIFMPGQEGFETIKRCRAEFPQTRIMVISSGNALHRTQDILATAKLLDVDAALRKPFDADALVDAVRRALQ